ncbi:MAG: DUF2066 domain-containing protein [Pseudomonadota bacterium]|nr:DUF2066 domain-containing protein [Pseudomonadota bacterium]
MADTLNAKGKLGDAFTVKGVHVDVTSTSSADARKKALANGQVRAFNSLLHRLVTSYQIDSLPPVHLDDVKEYVRDIVIGNEKNSPIRYIADLTVRFKPRPTRKLLRDLGIEFAETISKPVLILPIYEIAAAKSLWDNPNPWRDSWKQLTALEGLVPIKLPIGDLRDIGLIGAEQAVTGDEQRLSAIAKRYNVETVMVVYAALNSEITGKSSIRVNAISYGTDQRASALENNFSLAQGQSFNELLKQAAHATATAIEDRWKEDNIINFEQSAVLAAQVPIKELADWVEIQRRLKSVAIIERIDLVLISRSEARVNIFFLGDPDQLSLALAQADMKLEELEGNWLLGFKFQKKSMLIKALPEVKNQL